MQKYRVVVISPLNNPHVAAFTELAVSLVAAIRENGYSCDLAQNQFDSQAVNIILGFQLIEELPRDVRFIVYQLEQLSETEGWLLHKPHMLDILKKAEAVWDYSPENIEFLRLRDISADFLPAGFSPVLKQIVPMDKDVDILFYGSRNNRRGVVLQTLLEMGYNVKALFGIYGDERDRWISRSKLVINIHFYEANLFESVRVSYPVNNGVPVLSEISPSYPWSGVPLCMVPYDQLVSKAAELLGDSGKLASYGSLCQKQFEKFYSMKKLISHLLEK